MSKKVKNLMVAFGAMILFAFAVFFFLRVDAGQDLSINFAGYTNSATGVTTASFLVSNATKRLLFMSKNGSVQVRESGQWKDSRSTNAGVIPLLPNETFIVSVLQPTNREVWRIYMTSGQPRTSLMWRRIGDTYKQQPFQFEPLSYLLLSPVLRYTMNYSEGVTNYNEANDRR